MALTSVILCDIQHKHSTCQPVFIDHYLLVILDQPFIISSEATATLAKQINLLLINWLLLSVLFHASYYSLYLEHLLPFTFTDHILSELSPNDPFSLLEKLSRQAEEKKVYLMQLI